MTSSFSSVVANLYVPDGHVDQLAYELGKPAEQAQTAVLESAQALLTTYASPNKQRKLFWTNVDMVALNALMLNRCMRRKDAEAAARDVERFEAVLEPLGERLKNLINERKYSQFQATIKAFEQLGHDNLLTFKWSLEKCKHFREEKAVVLKNADEDELYKIFTRVCAEVAPDMQANVGKRLEYAIVEFTKLLEQLQKSTTASPSPSSSSSASSSSTTTEVKA